MRPRNDLTSSAAVGVGHSVTASTLFGSVEIPFSEMTCPTKYTSLCKNQHSFGFNFNPAS